MPGQPVDRADRSLYCVFTRFGGEQAVADGSQQLVDVL
jgi:hypothetical protein